MPPCFTAAAAVAVGTPMTSTGFVMTVAREYVAYGLARNERLDTVRIRASVRIPPPKGLVAVCIHRVRFDYWPVVEDPGQLGWKVFRKSCRTGEAPSSTIDWPWNKAASRVEFQGGNVVERQRRRLQEPS